MESNSTSRLNQYSIFRYIYTYEASMASHVRDTEEKGSSRISREELLSGMSNEPVERRGLLKSSLGVFASVFGFSRRSAANDVDRGELLTAARQYYSEQAIREAVDRHADDLLVKLSERGHLNRPSPTELPVAELRSAKAYATADSGAMVFAIEKDGQPAPRIEPTKQLPERRGLIVVVRPVEDRAYAVVKPTGETTTETGTTETITTQDDECPGCYEDCVCYAGCSPYDNCTCYYVCDSNCDCCYTDGSCYGCDKTFSC